MRLARLQQGPVSQYPTGTAPIRHLHGHGLAVRHRFRGYTHVGHDWEATGGSHWRSQVSSPPVSRRVGSARRGSQGGGLVSQYPTGTPPIWHLHGHGLAVRHRFRGHTYVGHDWEAPGGSHWRSQVSSPPVSRRVGSARGGCRGGGLAGPYPTGTPSIWHLRGHGPAMRHRFRGHMHVVHDWEATGGS